MSSPPTTTITLRALEGTPLQHDRLRDMVVAAAHAIAERQGIVVQSVEAGDDHVTAVLETGRIEAIGFAAELRRQTSKWYEHKFGVADLWGPTPEDEHEDWQS